MSKCSGYKGTLWEIVLRLYEIVQKGVAKHVEGFFFRSKYGIIYYSIKKR